MFKNTLDQQMLDLALDDECTSYLKLEEDLKFLEENKIFSITKPEKQPKIVYGINKIKNGEENIENDIQIQEDQLAIILSSKCPLGLGLEVLGSCIQYNIEDIPLVEDYPNMISIKLKTNQGELSFHVIKPYEEGSQKGSLLPDAIDKFKDGYGGSRYRAPKSPFIFPIE
jgi:hypothetical protein